MRQEAGVPYVKHVFVEKNTLAVMVEAKFIVIGGRLYGLSPLKENNIIDAAVMSCIGQI